MKIKRLLKHPSEWKHTKYVGWPAYYANPFVQVPKPQGGAIVRAVPRVEDERETLQLCIQKRDRLGESIWGKELWLEMLNVPKRSVTRPHKNRKGPANGVQLIQRTGRASYFQVVWYELERPLAPLKPGQTTLPRKRCVQCFSFGTPNSKYPTHSEAEAAAIATVEAKQAANAVALWQLENGEKRVVMPTRVELARALNDVRAKMPNPDERP